jgi:7 transmembrane sweet-taste receptor of 3 GCPR
MMTEKGAWAPVADAPFLFYDGTSNEPLPRRDVYDANYLSQGVQIAGLILASVAFIGVVGTGLWVFANRQNKLIKAGQPEFLYLLCFGAALVAPSSIFLSFDESDGLTTEQLSGLCNAFPWFFIVGYLVMYCALICKLWRLSKLMQMRRKAVHAQQVLFPILIIMGCCFVILIVWQTIDPATWVRKGISGKGLPYETYGECTSVKYGIVPFVVPMVLLMSIAVSATAVFSFKLRHVQSELSESSWIFAGIFLHIQTWLVGVPVLLITHGISSDAFYVMIMILTFTFATSLVGFVIGPKMYDILKDKYFGGKRAKSQISIGGGIARVSGISNQSLSFPTTNESFLSIGSNHGSSIKLSQSEHELLRLKNIELTMELESLNAYVAELEEAARQNNLSTGCHNHGAAQPFAYDEGTEEKMMNDRPEKSPNDTKISI